MAKKTKGFNPCPALDAERKYIRLQEIGLAQLLAIPIALMLLAFFQAGTFGNVCLTIFALATGGFCCLEWGFEKRQELRNNNSSDNCPK